MLDRFKSWLSKPRSADVNTSTDSLPAVEHIREDDDVSRFMQPDVPDELRQEALRTLFRQPKFNRRDGLDDYDEDYRLAHTGSRVGPNRQS